MYYLNAEFFVDPSDLLTYIIHCCFAYSVADEIIEVMHKTDWCKITTQYKTHTVCIILCDAFGCIACNLLPDGTKQFTLTNLAFPPTMFP